MDEMFNIVNGHHIEVVNKMQNKEIREWTDERRSEMVAAEKEEKAAEMIANFIIPKYCRGSERFQAAIGIMIIAIASIILSAIEVFYAVCGYESSFTCGVAALMFVIGAGTLLAELKFGK